MSKNGSITSFFRPLSQSSAATHSSSSPIPRGQTTSPPPPPLPTPPQPRTSSSPSGVTPETTRKSFSREAVIAGSDSEDDSDCSLDELCAVIRNAGHKQIPAPSRSQTNPCVTPRAKRTAVEFHSTPLTVRMKHKFTLDALVDDAQGDRATEASAHRIKSLFTDERKAGSPSKPDQGTALRDAIFDSVKQEDDDRKTGIMRAVDKTEATVLNKAWYFFDRTQVGAVQGNPFPKVEAGGNWKFLRNAKTREQMFVSGFARNILRKTRDLPDELFVWCLNELCDEQSAPLRQSYSDMVELCSEQIHHLVDAKCINNLFENIGATQQSLDVSGKVVGQPEAKGADAIPPYHDTDWARLASVLNLLGNISPCLSPESSRLAARHATKILLRLAVDNVVLDNVEVAMAYRNALQGLVTTIPRSEWRYFCQDICTSLHDTVEDAPFRLRILTCMPTDPPSLHELRRRLALVFLFSEEVFSTRHPDAIFNLRSIIQRVDYETNADFLVDRHTDHQELSALVYMLDIAIDDAGRDSAEGPAARKQFDADIDELVQELKEISSCISASASHISRLESKRSLEWLQKRLTYSVRTRLPQKMDIYDGVMLRDKEDLALPKQQEYMKNFFKPKPYRI